jgi:hypothetical protein
MAQLPEGIKMDADNLPEHCPPPHIFSTKYVRRVACTRNVWSTGLKLTS